MNRVKVEVGQKWTAGDKGPIYEIVEIVGNRIHRVCDGERNIFAYAESDGLVELSEDWILLNDSIKSKPAYSNGCVCKRCNSKNEWAVPNQPDGKTYICFECR